MPKRIDALVKPELLVWARETASFEIREVAKKLKIKSQKLEEWEQGFSRPTVKQLRKLSEIYKRPLAVFYLPEKPTDFQPLKDFRRLPDSVDFKSPAQFNIEIRQAVYRRQIALDLLEDLYGELPEFDYQISLAEDPEKIGVEIRKILKIDYKEQTDWLYDYDAFNKWRLAVEDAGVLTFQISGLDVKDIRGFSICEFPLPVIALNTKDSPKGRIFTLLHEFAHIMLKESSICDLNEDYERLPEEQRVEVFCNHVAGATLIPKQYLYNESVIKRNKGKLEWSNDDLMFLSKRFKVSKEVVLRRLLSCGFTTDSFYKAKREEFLKEYKRLTKTKTTGFVLPHRKVISSAGLKFVQLVLDSYHQEKITSCDLSDFLDVRLKHIPRIESETISKLDKYGVLS